MADLAGISVRTLHYYDQIGLLCPSFSAPNGYRYYAEKELMQLQQILFFRELEFSLEQIKAMMESPSFDPNKVLLEQRELLRLKRDRLDGLLNTVDETLESKKGVKSMSDNQILGNFSKKQMEEYKEEAKKRWGHTRAWSQSQERTKHWTDEDYKNIAKKGEKWTRKLAEMREKEFSVDSYEIQQIVSEHYNSLRTFYEPNLDMYKGLGQMYVDDPRFTAYYDRFGKGLAAFLRDAILVFVEKNTK